MPDYISKAFEKTKQIYFDRNSRLVFMSDVHRGDGTGADDFVKNRNIYKVALRHYLRQGFTYIELGDGDELWKNKKFSTILNTHKDIFELIKKFYQDGRLYMLYGNHDMVKRYKKWVINECYQNRTGGLARSVRQEDGFLFPGIEMYESLILTHRVWQKSIYLLHGHQADFLNYNAWKLARFLVRHVWRPLELVGIQDPTDTAHSDKKKNIVEKKLYDWCKKEDKMLIAGHTHRYVFPGVNDIPYFNDGCCVSPRYITAIEIENDEISLIKWSIQTRPDGVLYVGRNTVKGPVSLSEYISYSGDS